LQIDIDDKHDVFMCSKSIAKSFENLKDMKPPNEGIAVSIVGCFPQWGVLQSQNI